MFEPQINILALDDGLYQSLDKALGRALQYADKEPPKRKPSKRSGGIPQEQLDMILETADVAYLNEDWTEAVRTYMELLESGADLPPYLDARLSLSYASLNEWEPAFEHATRSYEKTPAESAAYIAMAKCCNLIVSMPEAGLRWLQLAIKALNAPMRVLKETKAELEEVVILSTYFNQA
jgi:tetratricopeptide (TPR) repeat protein